MDYCKNYRDVEQHKNKKRINLLEADIEDMEASFQEMKSKCITKLQEGRNLQYNAQEDSSDLEVTVEKFTYKGIN